MRIEVLVKDVVLSDVVRNYSKSYFRLKACGYTFIVEGQSQEITDMCARIARAAGLTVSDTENKE